MLGSPLARAEEAPGRGMNWGMAAPSPTLPRGTRIKVGTVGSLERILLGPAHVTDGSREPRRRAAPVDGGARARGRSGTCSGSRWSTPRRSRPRASPGSGAADEAAQLVAADRHGHGRRPRLRSGRFARLGIRGRRSGSRARSRSGSSSEPDGIDPRRGRRDRCRLGAEPARPSPTRSGSRSASGPSTATAEVLDDRRPAPRPRRPRADPPLRDAVGAPRPGTVLRPDAPRTEPRRPDVRVIRTSSVARHRVTFGRWRRRGQPQIRITAPADGHQGMDRWTRSGP